jgi:hypothetical protein
MPDKPHPNAFELKKRVLANFKETQKLAKKHSADVEVAFILELDGFLKNFCNMYHLD